MPDGRRYQVIRRFLHWTEKGEDRFTDAVAYYMPGSGEFMWGGFTFPRREYERWYKSKPYDAVCRLFPSPISNLREFLEVRNGEWIDVESVNGVTNVYHSSLRFASVDKGWRYVLDHPEETARPGTASGKWYAIVDLRSRLGEDFFRPVRLRESVAPYMYDSLTSVKKVGTEWQLEIKGADPPNRAVVILDKDFKLVRVSRFP